MFPTPPQARCRLQPLRTLGALCACIVSLQAVPASAAVSEVSIPTTSAEWASAQCVAALEVQTDALALQVKAGRADLRGLLKARLKAGAAFIGEAYLKGQRDEDRSHAVLQQALQAQQALPRAELAARQERCAQEGDKLLAAANPIGRVVVGRLADKRMNKLLAP